MTLESVKSFLRDRISAEAKRYFGLDDPRYIEEVTKNWFNDQENYDGRWSVIGDKGVPKSAKILDMAAGCGTFVLFGLHNGHDVWGIEPEAWKREYYKLKIEASRYPEHFIGRIVAGYGESLPFASESFDCVTTYQTLEHVQNVNKCIDELLRVLKPKGFLYLRAPDYTSFFEPHYRVPFLPKMNKKCAAWYLKMLGRPLSGLQMLNWTTRKDIIRYLLETGYHLQIESLSQYRFQKKIAGAMGGIPLSNNEIFVNFLGKIYECLLKPFLRLCKAGREEDCIELWITKC